MESNPRLWVGSLPYVAQRADIEDLFNSNGITVNGIDISIDPFTGRNPGYCFIDFHSDADAQRALQEMQGQHVCGRPVKLNHHTQKKRVQAKRDNQYVFDRWKQSQEAPNRWISPHQEGRRLYVGGLPRMPHQSAVNALMRSLFKDWTIEAVSKIISPHPSTYNKPGEHHYCFVDLPHRELAEQAALALDGSREPHGGAYRIKFAMHSYPGKVVREQLGGVYPGREAETAANSVRNLEGNWRAVGTAPNSNDLSVSLAGSC